MRSYQSHLQSLREKETFRASSLFPVLQNRQVKTRILFMGYWLLKRGIDSLSMKATLRDENGKTLHEIKNEITEAKAYTINVSDFKCPEDFVGSIEIEFFSDKPLVFPFPALSINYYGADFSTFVHTAERRYNDASDEMRNSQKKVAESGFNLICSDTVEPFIAMVNGSTEKADPATIQIAEETIPLENPKEPLETLFTSPKLPPGIHSAKVRSGLKGVYPRLLVGNRMKDGSAYSITHSYYDCSDASDESDYWQEPQDKWHQATLILPILNPKTHFTRATLYPIYSPSDFEIDVEFYTSSGALVKKISAVQNLELGALSEGTKACLARLIARGKRIPARIKIGYDIGNKKKGLPCNICTNLQPFIPSWDEKPFTFKWCPLIPHEEGNSTVWIVNSSQHKEYNRTADVTLTFYREEDSQTFEKKISIAPHGGMEIHRSAFEHFFKGQVGWMTATSDNPHILTYSFIETEAGHFGGDHGF